MLVQVSTYLSKLDLQSLVATSKSMFRLLLPEYLHRCGLVLKNTSTGGLRVELHNLSSYTSLGLWSTVYLFHPPEEMYCSIPCDTQEARGAIGFLSRFLLEPSNTCTLQDFHLSFCGTNPLLLTFDFVKMQRLFYSLPLTRLSFSGYASACYLPPSISLRGGPSCGSHTLTSFIISSDYGFAPGLMQTTVGILRHSHIKDLTIYMVSLNMSQWSSLLNGLNMVFLEDVELEGDIPWPALIRFLSKHKGLKNIRIRCGSLSKHTRPSRLRRQPFLPNILSLHAPLAVCHDIAERLSDSSKLYELKIETGQLSPFDPLFCRLLEILQHFQKLDHLGLQFVPSLPSTILSQSCPGDHDWDEYPARDLGQIRTLSFFQSQSQLSTGDSVCPLVFLLAFSTLTCVTGYDLCLCTIISLGRNGLCGRRRGRGG